jgi:CO/xanthine dehydrogenase Mo-binding subunit
MDNLRVIGKNVPFIDSEEKATGTSIYGTDVVIPHMLHGKILRSPYAHARIVHMDIERAQKLPGVRAVATPFNTPKKKYGLATADENFFPEEVHYIGDEVAAVAAVDKDTAVEACSLIKVDYEILTATFDPIEALKPGSPLVHTDQQSNLCYHTEITRGDIEGGFKAAAFVHEEIYHLPHQYHATLEPHCVVASWSGSRLTIWAPAQGGRGVCTIARKAFDIQPGDVRFIQTQVGGGFGGKGYCRLWTLAPMLAKLAGAPVSIVLDREEDMSSGLPSVSMSVKIKMGIDNEGYITAKDAYFLADNGAYAYKGASVLGVAVIRVDSLYRFKNVHVIGDLVYTNKVGTSAFRGFGNTQAHFAVESTLDTLAEKIGMDPMEIRLRNATQKGDTTIHGYVMKSCALKETIQKAAELTEWNEKRGKKYQKLRGIGMACGLHVSGSVLASPAGDGSTAHVRIHEDGSIQVVSSEGDIGQGAKTIMAQIAAEELQVSYQSVKVDALDTDVSYFGVGASGSRVTIMAGNAVRLAAKEAVNRLKDSAADKWRCNLEDVQFIDGKLINYDLEEELSIKQAATHYIGMTGGSRIIGEGRYHAQDVQVPDKTGYGNISMAYTFATHVAEVEVDVETGAVKLLHLTAVHDVGRAINPMAVEGQIEGGVIQGMGYSLLEEYKFEEGKVLNPNFTDYRIATSMDIPKIHSYIFEQDDPYGPYGAKSIGEMAMVPTPAAIANAIYNAIGIRMTQLPMTSERVLWAIKKSNKVISP